VIKGCDRIEMESGVILLPNQKQREGSFLICGIHLKEINTTVFKFFTLWTLIIVQSLDVFSYSIYTVNLR
jgi:hypothetical protein